MESHLHWADYLILAAFLVISLSIGVYHSLTGGRQKTTNEFIMGNRQMKVIPTAISLLVSFQSAVLLLGSTAEIFFYGIQNMIYCCIAAPLSLFVVERIIVPWLYPLKLVSLNDYLEKRYMSKSIRIFGASLGIISGVIYMGVAIYAPSAALESATGLPLTVSIPVMAVVSVAYTALGGMRAVIWTDVFQFVIMVGGMLAIVIRGLISVGGVKSLFSLVGEEGRLTWANVSVDPRERNTVWSLVFGMSIGWISAYGLSQASVQRFSAVNSLAKARTTILINIPPLIITNIMAGSVGLIVLAYYASIKCDPLANHEVANVNQLLPYFVVTIFADSPGFTGLFLATLYGGSLSSISSSLSGAAANSWEDILKWKLSHLPEGRKAIINRLLVVFFGFLSIGMAFFVATVPGPIIQVSIGLFSSICGPMMAIFLLGAISKYPNWKGMLVGGIMGFLITLWLNIGSMRMGNKHPRLPPLSMEQCSPGNGSSTLFSSSLNYTNYTAFDFVDGIDATDNKWNATTEIPLHSETQLQGLENFYALSYLWLVAFGTIVSGIIGIIASFIMRDKDLEAKVDERLLMRFRCCGWSDENENEDYLDDKNHASIQEVVPVLSQEKRERQRELSS